MAAASQAPAAGGDKNKLLSSLELEEKSFLDLLRHAIGNAEKLQNNPPHLMPQEDLMADEVVRVLAPYSGDKGPLKVRKVTYGKGRSNVILTYPGETDDVVSFVGSHMDVVPANPEDWTVNPFELTIDGDKLYGRGVTDCLGHVVMLVEVFRQLAILKPKLRRTIVAVLIANEEASEELGVGIDELEKQGELDHLKRGPVFWVDSADSNPTLGTGGFRAWELTLTGKKFHSGLPHKAINPIELANLVVNYLQRRFYETFNKFSKEEKEYQFAVGSSMKPTQIRTPPGSINQVPGSCVVSGDIRFTPFYSAEDIDKAIKLFLSEIDVSKLKGHGASRFHLPEEDLRAAISFKWLGHPLKGVAVNMKSPGYTALYDAIKKVRGECKPFSLTGSLPIIRDLQDSGFDVQICGFGLMSRYHAVDEYGLLSGFKKGARIVAEVIRTMDDVKQ